MRSIKALVWDLDGTLIHFKINSIKARRVAINVLKHSGIPKKLLSIEKPILENVKIAREIFKKEGFSSQKIAEIMAQVNESIIQVEYKAAIKASLIEGIDKVLEFARQKNLKQAIFTYNTYNNAKISLKTAKIDKYFEVIAGRDNVENLKPHPDHIKYICEKLNLIPSEIVIIGDSGRDIEAALQVGAYSIALNTKLPILLDRESFKKADKIIEQSEIPSEIIKTLKKIF
ncbi:MAG: HAD family hydrolase [Promethearchaeota archaeon]